MPVKLLRYPDPSLRAKARDVTDEEFESGGADGYSFDELMVEMAGVMHRYGGVGLAGPQVGVGLRLWMAKFGEEEPVQLVFNPVLSKREGLDVAEEGCLSIPNVHGNVERASRVTVEGRNSKGAPITLELEGLAARVAQHETDHLDGILFLDHVEKDLALKTLKRGLELPEEGDPVAIFVKNRRRMAWRLGGDEMRLGLDPFYLQMVTDGKAVFVDLDTRKRRPRKTTKQKKRKRKKKRR